MSIAWSHDLDEVFGTHTADLARAILGTDVAPALLTRRPASQPATRQLFNDHHGRGCPACHRESVREAECQRITSTTTVKSRSDDLGDPSAGVRNTL